jgi:exodeoxyribonuclease-3
VSDEEGRVLQLDFGDIRVINAYFLPALQEKSVRVLNTSGWMNSIYIWKNSEKYPRIVLCGDYNIAHREIDIHDPKEIRIPPGSCPRNGPGWINFWQADGLTVSVKNILNHTDTAGGVSVSPK